MKRFLAVIMLFVVMFFPGCSSSRKIETAAIIENVSVTKEHGQLYYTFYKLSSDEKPHKTVIPASSFEDACRLAKEKYIPHLSLAKLRLLLVHIDLKDRVMQDDISYISTQTYFSPVAYVALCDGEALRRVGDSPGILSTVEEKLRLCQKNHPSVKLDYLSIFNSLQRNSTEGVEIAYINSDKELKTDIKKIFRKMS